MTKNYFFAVLYAVKGLINEKYKLIIFVICLDRKKMSKVVSVGKLANISDGSVAKVPLCYNILNNKQILDNIF